MLDHLLRPLDVVGKGCQRILHRVQRRVTTAVQLNDDLRPVRRTTPETVNEHDTRLVAHFVPLFALPLVPMSASSDANRPADGSPRRYHRSVAISRSVPPGSRPTPELDVAGRPVDKERIRTLTSPEHRGRAVSIHGRSGEQMMTRRALHGLQTHEAQPAGQKSGFGFTELGYR